MIKIATETSALLVRVPNPGGKAYYRRHTSLNNRLSKKKLVKGNKIISFQHSLCLSLKLQYFMNLFYCV